MTRCLIICLLATVAVAAEPAVATPPSVAPTAGIASGRQDVDRWVALFNQDLLPADKAKRAPLVGVFDAPASDIAREVRSSGWFSFLVFLPFLILPQVLLIYIIFKYRRRDDGRAPATFMGNHKLELLWTAIPCVALFIVGIPMWGLVTKMNDPPEDQRPLQDMVIEVRGHQFAWAYKYQRLGGGAPTRREDQFEVGVDASGFQEPLVLVKDRRVIINLTSNDVNHAWWVPAFGVKQDAIEGRYTRMWFTPDRLGFFKGQCAELCGQGHGIMLISALVLDEADFAVWTFLQRDRGDTVKIWMQLSAEQVDAKALEAAVTDYLGKGATPERLLALRFWIASEFTSQSRRPGTHPSADARRDLLDTYISRHAGPNLAGN